jgi:hypothetical protein
MRGIRDRVLEPRVLDGAVVRHDVRDHANIECVRVRDERVEVV